MRIDNLTKLDIVALAAGLQDGESRSCVCPVCAAGHEKSFSVTVKDDNILFICFRATCGAKGRMPLAHPPWPKDHLWVQHPTSIEVARRDLSPIEAKLYASYLGVDFSKVDRYLMSAKVTIATFNGVEYLCFKLGNGAHLRSLPWVHGKECRTIVSQTAGNQHEIARLFYASLSNNPRYIPYAKSPKVIFCEDPSSAIKLHIMGAQRLSATIEWGTSVAIYAICGTNLSQYVISTVMEAFRAVPSTAFIAFDPDAHGKAIEYSFKYSTSKTRVMPLLIQKDIKRLSEKEIMEWLDYVAKA